MTPASSMDFEAGFASSLPHLRALDLRVVAMGEGEALIAMRRPSALPDAPRSESHADPRAEGGDDDPGLELAMTALDTAGGCAVAALAGSCESPATLDLRIEPIVDRGPEEEAFSASRLPPPPAAALFERCDADILAAARTVSRRNALCRVDAELFTRDRNAEIQRHSRAFGAFIILPASRSPDAQAPKARSPDKRQKLADAYLQRDPVPATQRPFGTEAYRRFLQLKSDDENDTLTMPFRPALIGNPEIPALHGGVVASLLHAAAWRKLQNQDRRHGRRREKTFAVSHSLQYLRRGEPKDTHAQAVIERRGRRVTAIGAAAWQDFRNKPVAVSQTLFMDGDP